MRLRESIIDEPSPRGKDGIKRLISGGISPEEEEGSLCDGSKGCPQIL